MSPRSRVLICLSVTTLALVVSGCVSSDSAIPSAPSPDVSTTADGSTLKVDAPTLQAPIGDALVGQPPYTLVASSVAGIPTQAPLTYRIEVHDSNGILIQDSGTLASPVFTINLPLQPERRYTWRARAELAELAGPWSTTGSFFTPPAKAPNPCGHLFDPVGIIGCWIGIIWDDSVGPGEFLELTKAVAKDLNRAGIEGGPFGVLRKTTGNNCNGYACDIICAGQGNDQVQYDFLIADELPVWQAGHSVDEGIRVDICEIQWPD